MNQLTEKELILKALSDLPDDASIDDAMERLYVLYKVERGLEDARAGNKVSQEEARRLMAKWLP